MRTLLFALFILLPQVSSAYLTSDVDFGAGYTGINFKTGDVLSNLTSLATVDTSYNLNVAAWNSSINLVFSESLMSNQGPLSWTRVGVGARYYLTGFNGQRVIFDNRVEGYYWRPAPFVGISGGFSSFSIASVGGSIGYFNAVGMDIDFRAGAEVVLATNLFLTGQWSLLYGLPSSSPKTGTPFSYTGTGLYLGLKITSF